MEQLSYGIMQDGLTAEAVREWMFLEAEGSFREFASSLIPGVTNMIGIRLPKLRKLAAVISKGDFRRYLAEGREDYFEEVMLKGMIIGCVRVPMEERLVMAASFVPKINNWSVCDSFCSGFKAARDYRKEVWNFITPYLLSGQEYGVRFGAVMILNYFADEEYAARAFAWFDRISCRGYYDKMAVAWAVSVFFNKLPCLTWEYLDNNNLDQDTYEKALRKIIESKAAAAGDKERIRERICKTKSKKVDF